jgi:hypothetical protein
LSAKKEFLDKVDSLRDKLVALTRQMVGIPSENPPGDERAISELVSRRLDSLGFDARAQTWLAEALHSKSKHPRIKLAQARA